MSSFGYCAAAACVPGDLEEDDEAAFVAWRDAAIQCLPEHYGTVAEVLSLIGSFPESEVSGARQLANDEARKARRVSKQRAVEVIGSACMSWDNPFYILAVGRGNPSGLRPDAVAGLLALLVGHKPTNMHLTQAALLALARIFAGSKDQLMSKRILTVWENHENTDVRADALLALYLLGNIDIMRYAFTIRDLTNPRLDVASLWHYCKDSRVMPEAKIDWPYMKGQLSHDKTTKNHLVFLILRLRIAADDEIEAVVSVTELCDMLVKYVLANGLSRRLVLQATLALVDAHPNLVKKLPDADRESFMDALADLAEVSVFYEVRKGATAALQKFADVRAEIFGLLAVPEKIDKTLLKESLLSRYPGLRPTEAEDSGVVGIFKRNYGGKFADYLRACRNLKSGYREHHSSYRVAPDSKEYPSIVAIYYLLLQVEDVPGEVISELLASRRYVDRQMALIHVGVSQRSAFRSQVVHLKANDPIRDVRLCAIQVLDLLQVASEVSDPAYRIPQLYNELLDRERLNLVLDLEFITRMQEESKALEFLASFVEE